MLDQTPRPPRAELNSGAEALRRGEIPAEDLQRPDEPIGRTVGAAGAAQSGALGAIQDHDPLLPAGGEMICHTGPDHPAADDDHIRSAAHTPLILFRVAAP